MIGKIDNLEKRFSLLEKLFDEVETLKKEVHRLSQQSKPNDAFKRFEVEQKKKSVLVKGLESMTNKKYEPRHETQERVNELFEHVGLALTLEDYQRLGPIKPDDTGSTLVRLQFWTKDEKTQLFSKFKEFSNDPIIKKISLINDYPSFQLAEVKKLSDEAYQLRQRDRAIKTRIVPRGLEVQLQTRRGPADYSEQRKPKHGQPSLILVLLLAVTITSVHSLDKEIESMREEGLEKHDISIFVEEKVEYIHAQIPLQPLITGIDRATKLASLFSNRVNTSLGRILNAKIQRRANRTSRRLIRLNGKREQEFSRKKRAIEFVGNLISKLFGNPGPEEWRQNSKNVLAMKEAIERQLANSIIQHHDIDKNRHAINEQNEILKQITKEVIGNENRLDNVNNELTELESYLELVTMYESIDEILESLEIIKRDARFGMCNERGMNPDFLIEHIRKLESNKNSIAPIFASWEWQQYYKYKMCAVALHEKELWITLRIPIVNLAEQLVRAVPTTDQTWIESTFLDLGFHTALFKAKNRDQFMVITKSNLELCSILGSARVCNVRKTKFREHDPYLVPLDINHDRILVVTNSTVPSHDIKSICKTVPLSLTIQNHTILRMNENCVVLSRSIEISRVATNKDIKIDSELANIETVRVHPLKRVKSKPKIDQTKNIPDSENHEFDRNVNETKASLDSVTVDSTWSKENMLITASGTSTGLLALVVVVCIILLVMRKCKSNDNNRVTVQVSTPNDLERANKLAEKAILQNADEAEIQHREFLPTQAEDSRDNVMPEIPIKQSQFQKK